MNSLQNSIKKILTIGSALVDIFVASDQFEISHGEEEVFTTRSSGGKLSVDSFAIKTGGGGGNTAAGFAKMGFDVGCIAELGVDELSEIVVSDLHKHSVKTTYLIQERKEETGGSVLLVTSSGERTALVHRGAAAMLDPHDIDESVIAKHDWIHLSSVAGRTQTIQEIFKFAAQHGVPISWNPGQAELEALAAHSSAEMDDLVAQYIDQSHPVHVLLLNKQEWESIASVQDQMKAVVPHIVITDSIRGGKLLEREVDDQGTVSTKEHSYEAVEVTSVDNTGAGDAFAVGFISARLHGHSIETALQWASRNAAAVVQKSGAKNGLLSMDEIQNYE